MKMNQKGQASLEMAAFGSMILIALVSLFSYGQKVNDQQYLLMSAFRHALANAHGLEGGDSENGGFGGAASYTIIETPRYYAGDLSHKGSRSTVSGGGSVLWGKLPISTIEETDPVTNEPYTTIDLGDFGESSIYKINEDEIGAPSLGEEEEGVKKEVDIEFESYENVQETVHKAEDSSAIATTNALDMTDKLTTMFVEVRTLDNDDSSQTVTRTPISSITQYLYRDSDGRYKYSQAAGEDSRAIRSQTWITPHEEN